MGQIAEYFAKYEPGHLEIWVILVFYRDIPLMKISSLHRSGGLRGGANPPSLNGLHTTKNRHSRQVNMITITPLSHYGSSPYEVLPKIKKQVISFKNNCKGIYF